MATNFDDLPPSYESIASGFCYVSQISSQLVVVDFIPETREIRFPRLIDRANVWLQKNGNWRAKTCESIEFKSKAGVPCVQRVTFTEKDTATVYVRGLRLWLVPREYSNLPAQRLAYFDAIPKTYELLFTRTFERFDCLLQRVNDHLAKNPINGKIINVETQPMKFSFSKLEVDSDKSYFTDMGDSVFVIRIFYEVGPPAYEYIGSVDFLPQIHVKPYDTIPNLVSMASDWCRIKPENYKVCSIQTIGMKRKKGFPNMVDNMKTSITEIGGKHITYYYRILRLFFITIPKSAEPTAYPSFFQGPLTCKTFLPVQLTKGNASNVPTFESTQQTLTRISEWVKQHNVHIISAETCVVRMYKHAKKYGPESTYYRNEYNQDERFINIVRLYLDGDYADPHISMSVLSYHGWSSHPIRDISQIRPKVEYEECVLL